MILIEDLDELLKFFENSKITSINQEESSIINDFNFDINEDVNESEPEPTEPTESTYEPTYEPELEELEELEELYKLNNQTQTQNIINQPKTNKQHSIKDILNSSQHKSSDSYLKDIGYQISNEYLQRYEGAPYEVIKDLEIFTKVFDSFKGQEPSLSDAKELENYRSLPANTLVFRSIVYSENSNLLSLYPELSYTSMMRTDNNIYEGRYLIPIRMINGDIYTFMGYNPYDQYNKYQIPKIENESWIGQGRMLGNLDSLSRYPKGSDILIVEGMFDAIHAEARYKTPVIATLGVNLNIDKVKLLWQIKRYYRKPNGENCRFILVMDYDEAGTEIYRMRNKLWDLIFDFNKGKKKNDMVKDIDDYLVLTSDENQIHWDEF